MTFTLITIGLNDQHKSIMRMGEKIIKQGKAIKSAVLDENQEIMKKFVEKYKTDIEVIANCI